MTRKKRLYQVGGLLLITAAALLLVPSASAVCETDPVDRIFDYARDLQDPYVGEDTDIHPEVDILEIRSCMVGDDVTVVIRTRADVAADNPNVEYGAWVSHPTIFQYSVFFSNGTATHYDYNGDVDINVTWAGKEVVMKIPNGNLNNISDGWTVKGQARVDEEGDGLSDWIDDVDLNTFDEYGDVDDISTEPTPFAAPTVTVDSVKVEPNGTAFLVTIKGKTAGSAAEVRISMGVLLRVTGGSETWSYPPYYKGQARTEGDMNVELLPGANGWSTWTFVRQYTNEQLRGMLGSLVAVTNAKVEVRAIATDGSWGHANETFPPLQAYDSEAPSANGGSGGGFLPGFEAAAVAVAAFAVSVAGRRDRRP